MYSELKHVEKYFLYCLWRRRRKEAINDTDCSVNEVRRRKLFGWKHVIKYSCNHWSKAHWTILQTKLSCAEKLFCKLMHKRGETNMSAQKRFGMNL